MRQYGQIKVVQPGESHVFNVASDEYSIYLPHSCDEWVIAANTDKEKMLEEARAFRANLDLAIRDLEK